MSVVIEKEIDGWLYLINPTALENKLNIHTEVKKPHHGTVGKYLFFSDDKQVLIELGKEILIKFNLYNAKVPLSDVPRKSEGFGFVLCVYDSQPTLKNELRHYGDNKKIHYRYWKSDERTQKGEYSDKFLGIEK